MSQQNEKISISVFGFKPKDAIMVPELPIGVRNNCQSGQWFINDKSYGQTLSMTIVKFSKFFGNLGQTKNELWGQIWFIAESGELPQNVVMVTYIKTRSLNNFNRLITEIQSREIEPAEGIFIPSFVKHSGQKDGKPINYYSLEWDWTERTDWSMIEKAAAMLSDPNNLALMNDINGTQEMVCIDNLPASEIACLMQTRISSFSGRSLSAQILPEEENPF